MMDRELNKKPLIVMVDDSETDLDLNLYAIRKLKIGVEVKEFRNGHEALDFMRETIAVGRIPSLLVLDLKMPQISGYDVLALMQETGMKNFPIVVMSGSSLLEDIDRAKELGADDYYEKPIDLTKTYHLFKRICSRYLSEPNMVQAQQFPLAKTG